MIRSAATARHALLAGVLLLAVLGLACGLADALATSPSASPSDEKTVLRVGWIMDVDTLNPFTRLNASSWEVCSLNYDSLVGLDAATLTYSGGTQATGLATDWTVSSDGKTWTFTLRDDAAWQDGRGPVTADDVAFTYNYVLDSALTSVSMSTAGVRRAVAIDSHTVRIDCTRPKADMLNLAWSLPILPEHIWSRIDPDQAGSTYRNGPPIVGSGPFQCVEFKKGGYVRMVANEAYYRGAPQVDEILFEFYTNPDTMAWDLEAGTIDACFEPGFLAVERLQKTPGFTARAFQAKGYDNLVINCYAPPAGGKSLGHPVLRDWRFRQALQWAVDRDKIVDVVYHGVARPGDTAIVPGYSSDPDWHWSPPASEAYGFDLERAGQALDAAGYRDVNGDGVRDYRGEPIELRLWAMSEYVSSQTEVKLIASWLRQIDLEIDVATMPMGAMYDRIYNMEDGALAPDFDLCQSGWWLGLDPGANLSWFTTAQIGNSNDSGFSNAELDRLFVEQGRTLDTMQRKQLTDRIQQIVYEQSPYIILDYFGDTEAWSDKWVGWVTSPRNVGSAVSSDTVDSYLYVRPRSGDAVTSAASSSGSLAVALAAVAGAAMVTGGLVLWRRRKRPEEE